jgi:hypothetical protein
MPVRVAKAICANAIYGIPLTSKEKGVVEGREDHSKALVGQPGRHWKSGAYGQDSINQKSDFHVPRGLSASLPVRHSPDVVDLVLGGSEAGLFKSDDLPALAAAASIHRMAQPVDRI